MSRTRLIFVGILGLTAVIILSTLFTSRPSEELFGVVGSEKIPFFEDERVQDVFKQHGYVVTVQKAGSREIATSFNLTRYDFAFPAGAPAAEKIQQTTGISQSYTPFFTPMAIASWQPIAQLLQQQGIAQDQGGYYTLDMARFLALMADETRWSELEGNDAFSVNKSILLTSTDIRKSNSAAMYLALASYVANGNNIVQTTHEANPFMPLMADIFLRQGLRPDSSQEPFEDYLVKGMGHSPIVMIYESQFIAQAALNNGSIQPNMVLMYPEPTIFTKHILIPLSDSGNQIGQLLENDPDLKRLAVEYGLRNDDLPQFRQFISQLNINIPEIIIAVVEPPTYEVLEGMIQQIEQKYREQGGSS